MCGYDTKLSCVTMKLPSRTAELELEHTKFKVFKGLSDGSVMGLVKCCIELLSVYMKTVVSLLLDLFLTIGEMLYK